MTSNIRIDEMEKLLSEKCTLASPDDAPTNPDVAEAEVDSAWIETRERKKGPASASRKGTADSRNRDSAHEENRHRGVISGGGDVLATPPRSSVQSVPDEGIKMVKIPIPTEPPNFKYIGRLLGPRGTSIRELEQATKCKLLIKGRGSMRDPERENQCRHRPGYEHLWESLHVRIIAVDDEEADTKLEMARKVVENLLIAKNDIYKQRQLVQLSLINGTYRPDYSILKQQVQPETKDAAENSD